jgi:hypothetical protein
MLASRRSRFLRALLLLAVTALPLQAVRAQGELAPSDARHAEILSVVTRLFDGMRTSDTALVRTLFHPDAQLMTTLMADGQPAVREDSLAAFLRSIGTVRAEQLDERIKNPRVYVDGPLASVWTEYDLFVGTRFIHCGVDAFHLAKVGERWQILALADTRRREGCTPAMPS